MPCLKKWIFNIARMTDLNIHLIILYTELKCVNLRAFLFKFYPFFLKKMYKILSRNLHQATNKYIINIKVYVKKENTFLHVKKKNIKDIH